MDPISGLDHSISPPGPPRCLGLPYPSPSVFSPSLHPLTPPPDPPPDIPPPPSGDAHGGVPASGGPQHGGVAQQCACYSCCLSQAVSNGMGGKGAAARQFTCLATGCLCLHVQLGMPAWHGWDKYVELCHCSNLCHTSCDMSPCQPSSVTLQMRVWSPAVPCPAPLSWGSLFEHRPLC